MKKSIVKVVRKTSKVNNFDSDGCWWNNRDLRQLSTLMTNGYDINTAAIELGRMPSACDKMWREIRRMEVMRNGSEEDTLRSWAKKQEALSTTSKTSPRGSSNKESKNTFTGLTMSSDVVKKSIDDQTKRPN